MLDNTPNQLSKFRTKNWVEINDSRGTYNFISQIKCKTSMLKSSLCDYTDAYQHVKEPITFPTTRSAAASNNKNKKTIFKNCVSFTDCINEINNKQVDNAKDIDVVMPICNFIEYRDIYSKTTGILYSSFPC